MKLSPTARYVAGFLSSVTLTLAAFWPVWEHVQSGHNAWSHSTIIPVIIGLALVQLVVQLVLFLHLGDERKPRWNLITFGFAAMVVVIVVFGSLWIMNNLDYNMMQHPAETDSAIMQDEGMHH